MMESQTGSIYQLLQLIRQLKNQANNEQKPKQISLLSFSDKFESQEAHKSPLLKIDLNNMNSTLTSNEKNKTKGSSFGRHSVFEKLYQQGKQLEQRKYRLEYENRKSKQQKQQSQCTFSPNLKLKQRLRTEYDSVDQNESFYIKNLQWQERKEKSIKVMQCEKNQGKVNELTFTPRINKYKNKYKDQENRVAQNKGVRDFLDRQTKAKHIQRQIEEKKKNPYNHIWNVKKGHFSYIK